ncbi:MAG TPA: ADP-ribosylglycohydrolase family protein [Candidatus Ruania gallistercoris]|uniref:ADP-ribosylglycohydrolase family protein n=1 Tax=Candidatus Ruania gallistercoris TaxID=2838746 RepID=A0A9D2J2F6_9MICO|nr:ADP-ribosylglycohydrolase family protein [Candidatus Ruania gallistercoris]
MALLSQSTERTLDRAAGALLGLALGDAMGRPGRGWPQHRIRGQFGWIADLVPVPAPRPGDGPAGTMGAATRAAFTLAAHWPQRPRAPLTRRPVRPDATSLAAHRLLPVGIACRDAEAIAAQMARLGGVRTTASALAAATLVAGVISSAVDAPDGSGDPMFLAAHLEMGFRALEEIEGKGPADVAPSVVERSLLAREIAVRAPDDEAFLTRLYDVVGVSKAAAESVPAAVGLLIRAEADPTRTSVLAANLGGETSRIGALATAMAGAVRGRAAVASQWRVHVENVNSVCSVSLAQQLLAQRS